MTYLQKRNLIIAVSIIFIVAVSLGWGKIYIEKIKNSMTTSYEAKIETLQRNEGKKVEALKEDIMDRLKQCESGDLTLDDAPIILDSNHEMSIGLYMFQRDTVIYYYEKFYGKTISRREAVEIAISEEARELAKRIIFEETGGIYNWTNCAKREGLVSEITVIKKLQ